MEWPQITIIVIFAVSLGIDLAKHGERKKEKHDFVGNFIVTAIIVFILWQGGFWS